MAQSEKTNLDIFYDRVDEELANTLLYDPWSEKPVPVQEWLTNQNELNKLNGEEGFDPEMAYEELAYAIKSEEGSSDFGKMLRDEVVNVLREMSPGGQFADNTGMTQEEYENLKKIVPVSYDAAYPERLQPNYDAMRQAELFQTMSPNAQGQNFGTKALNFLGGPFDLLRGRADTAQLAASSIVGTPEDKAYIALYWNDRAKEDPYPELSYRFTRNPMSGDSYYQTLSTATMSNDPNNMGFFGSLGQDTSKPYGKLANKTINYTLHPGISREERNYIQRIKDATNRPTPIIPYGQTPETMQENKEFVQDYENAMGDYGAAVYGAAHGHYPSPVIKNLMETARYAAEPATAIDLASAGLGTKGKSLLQGLGNFAKQTGRQVGQEFLVEDPGFDYAARTGQNLSEEGGTVLGGLAEPFLGEQSNLFMGPDAPPPFMTEEYKKAFGERQKDWSDKLSKKQKEF